MELSNVFGGDTLKAADLQGREPSVVIETVQMKKFDNGNKLVITFQGKKKALVCNKTNANRIAYAYGTNTDDWVGREITLYTDLVDFQGTTVEAIRIRPPMKRATSAPTPTPTPTHEHVVTQRDGYQLSEMRPVKPVADPQELDDPIPF